MAKAAAVHTLYIRLRSTDGTWIAPPKLRARLVADAKRESSNLHDVAVGILSAAFHVPFLPSGRHTKPKPGQEELNLRVSSVLWQKLGANAAGSRQRLAIEKLAGHYDLAMPKRSRARAAA